MKQGLKLIMTGLFLLKLIVIGSLITATAIVALPGEASAQTVGHRKVQRPPQQTETWSSVRRVLQGEELLKTRRSQTGIDSALKVDTAHRDSFDLGFAFVRAMYFAGLSETDQETNQKAIVELVYLIDRLEHQPDEAVALQKVLQMVVRGSGAGWQRWEAIQRVIISHGAGLKGEVQWYFNSGVSVFKLFMATYLNDSTGIKSELQNLQSLTRIAPQSVPRDVLAHMQSLLLYFNQTTFTENDRAAVIAVVEKIIVTVTA